MTTKKNNSAEWHKGFSFGEAFHKIGLELDSKLDGVNNPVLRDLAGMDAIICLRNLLCGNIITSFTLVIGIESPDEDGSTYASRYLMLPVDSQ